MTGGRSGGAGEVVTTYVVDVGGASITVGLIRREHGDAAGAGGGHVARVDGVEVPAALIDIPGSPIRLLRLGDAVYEIVTDRGEQKGSLTISIGGVRVATEALDDRARALRDLRKQGGTAAAAGPEVLRAPMPGMVSRVLVGEGDTVDAGDGLVVIEAMKMENELKAKSAGRVRAIRAVPGTAVEKGAVLIELE